MSKRGRLAFGFVAVVIAVSCRTPASAPPTPAPTPVEAAAPEIDRDTPLPSPLPDIVARVNGQPIRIGQVLALAQKGLTDSKDRAKDMPGAVRFAVQQYIARELLLQKALADGLTADTAKVEAAFDQVRGQFKNEKAWLDSLSERGLDPQSFKQELRAQETVNVLMSREGDAVQVSDEELRAYFDQNPHAIDPGERLQLQQIFFAVTVAGERAREAARVKASIVQKKALAGEDFTKLVTAYSQDKTTREALGRLEIKRGMKSKSYDAAAFALEPGQVDLVDTPEGVYVLRLEERIPGPPPRFEDVRADLKSALLSQKRQAAYDSLVNRLRAKARIETYL
jgi:parvulin-like peptidyl-prolyl isomerase